MWPNDAPPRRGIGAVGAERRVGVREQFTAVGYPAPSAYDATLAQAARQLRPGVLTEQQWRRRSHADLPDLADWELRRELRVIALYLDTLVGQRDWLRTWYVERRQRLHQELRRRREAEQRGYRTVSAQERSPAPPASTLGARGDCAIVLPWRGGRQ